MNLQLLNALVNATTDFIAVTDHRGLVLFSNCAFADHFGLAVDQLVGSNLSDHMSEPLIKTCQNAIEHIQQGGTVQQRIEHQENGGYYEYAFFPLHTPSGMDNQVAIFVRDISTFKAMVKEHETNQRVLRELNSELEGIIRIASHDLKTPLVTINGFAGELTDACQRLVGLLGECDKPGPLKEQIQGIIQDDILVDVDLIKAGTNKVESLISSLLKLARIGYQQPRPESMDMNNMIDQIIKSMAFEIKAAEVEIQAKPLCACYGDQSMINQVMTNLISNAIKYRHPNRPAQITISCHKQSNECVYCVADNGIGVEPSQQEKIFELFYRLNPQASEGQGLGLSIVRGILNRHNGRIWLESEPGKGTRFYVTFPDPSSCHAD